MFAYIKGILVSFNPSQVVIDVQGIGYLVHIPCNALGHISEVGKPIQLFTSFVIREYSQALYGFTTNEEKDLFESLLNVSGVGPKLALSLIGHLSPAHLQMAISQGDLATLCKVPGVGKKTAERLVVELKDKISQWSFGHLSDLAITLEKDPKHQRNQDAILALINLGYTQAIAQKAVRQSLKDLSEECELSALITASLHTIRK